MKPASRQYSRIFLFALVVVATIARPVIAADTDPVPKRFSTTIGGKLGPSYSVELKDGALTYEAFEWGGGPLRESVRIVPTAEQWRSFYKSLDEIDVWRWRRTYINNNIRDGTSWSLAIETPDQKLTTGGSNSYPGVAGKLSNREIPPKEFMAYLAAVRVLIGGKPFG